MIGTYALPLSHISMSSGTGMGFLPCILGLGLTVCANLILAIAGPCLVQAVPPNARRVTEFTWCTSHRVLIGA